MTLLNTFDPATTVSVLTRIEKLTAETKPEWGKMNVAQMLAHVNVGYDVSYGVTPTKKPNFIMKLILKGVKKIVVGDAPYKKNGRTAPSF